MDRASGDTFTREDKKYMGLALTLAAKAHGFTSPNPVVGAVIVKDGKIISCGYHKRAGLAHAEIEAINAVSDKNILKGSKLYVTLEPCSIYGKTGPCTDAIIKHGFKEVIMACIDPNPKVNGKSIRLLNSAGIKTMTGLMEDKAVKQNEVFFKHIRKGAPFITAKVACSIDGKTATRTKDSKWITGEKSRKLVHRIRGYNDCVLTGINTVIADNPELLPYRIDSAKKYYRAILDSRLKLDIQSKIVKTAPICKTIVFCSESIKDVPSKSKKQKLFREKGIDVIFTLQAAEKSEKKGSESIAAFLDLQSVIKVMHKKYGVTSILVEAGKTVLSSFLKAGLIDKFIFFTAPKIIGGDSPYGIFSDLNIYNINKAINLRFDELKRVGQDIMITAYPC